MRAIFLLVAVMLQVTASQAATLNWGTVPATDLLTGTNTTTVSGVTITTSGTTTDPASDASRILQIMPTVSTNGYTGGVVSQFDATTDNGSIRSSITLTFSQPVSNVSFTIVDIDGGVAGSWNDNIQFSASPAGAYPTATSVGSNVTYNSATGLASANGNAVSDATGSLTINYPGPITSLTVTHIAADATGTDPGGQFIMMDDVTFTPTPTTVKLQKITQGGFGGPFTFAATNLATAPGNITTTAANTATPAAPAAINVTTVGNAVTLTETPASGYVATAGSCTDANYLVTGNPSTAFGSLAGNVLTIPAGNVKAGSNTTCVFTNARKPTVKVQKITEVATGGPFTFSATNLAAAIPNITTAAVNTATPASPTAIDVSSMASAVTITETPAASFALKSATCTDAAAPGDGNPAAVGSVSGNVLTIPAANMVAGAAFTCVFTNTRLPAITLRKVSLGGTGSFTLTGTNGVGTQTLATTAPGVAVSGVLTSFTTASTATTITEAVAAGYALTGASCTGLGAGTATLAGNVLSLNAAATAAGNNVTCTFTNSKLPTVQLSKTSSGFVGTFNYSGSNGFGADAITTTTSGTAVNGAVKTLNAAALAGGAVITETLDASFIMVSASCSGLGTGGTATVNTAAGTITLNAAATAPGAVITCAISNAKAVPSVAVAKTASPTSITAAGAAITYSIAVSNTGNVPVSTISVSDPRGTVVCPTSGAATIASLAAGASETCTLNYTATQADFDSNGGGDGKIDNTATATGSYAGSPVAASGSAAVAMTVNPKLTVLKKANTAGPLKVGDIVTYTYTVTNTGNVTMHDVMVNDSHNGSGTFVGPGSETLLTDVAPTGDSTDSPVSPKDAKWSALGPGDALTFTATYAVTQHDLDSLQ